MKIEEYVDYLVNFLKENLEITKAKGYVVGLSGGIDSALVAALIKKATSNSLALILPLYSAQEHVDDAIMVANQVGIDYKIIDLNETYDAAVKTITSKFDEENALAFANTKARLRMTTLYAVAQLKGYLVCGTDNADEYYTGYFTKFGDGAYDILPTRYLTKHEVREAAKYLGIDQKIIDKIPTADILPGVSDEDEMGVSYKDLDDYLLGKEINPKAKEIIEHLHKVSEHKRKMALMPKEFER